MEKTRIFFSYSHKDEKFRDELAAHLKVFERMGKILSWHDRKIIPGESWKNEISENLKNADIILALVSSDFLASDYCYEIELKSALDQHSCRRSILIPIIIRPVNWYNSPLGKLQALPTDAKPISEWNNIDGAWVNVTDGILRSIEVIEKQKKQIFENIPSSKLCVNYINTHIDFIKGIVHSEDNSINRNVDRLKSISPDAWENIIDYKKSVENFIIGYDTKTNQIYELIFSNSDNSTTTFNINSIISEILFLLMTCNSKESKVILKLQKEKLNCIFFGFSRSEVMIKNEMEEIYKLMYVNMLNTSDLYKEITQSTNEVKDITSDDFEKV